MNSRYGITPENLLRALPDVLKGDQTILALAAAIAGELAALADKARKAAINPNIGILPEEILDQLATDFKVDWWNCDYTVEEKRGTLESSWYVHRHLGTKRAVERAISAIYPDSVVSEWFEYGGKAYHFKLLIPVDQTALDPEKHGVVLSLVAFYKNLRSVLEDIEYFGSGGITEAYAAAAYVGCEISHGATAADH